MERDPRQNCGGLHVDADAGQVVGAALELKQANTRIFLKEFVMRKLFRQLIVASMVCLPMASAALAQGAKAAQVVKQNSSVPAKQHRLLIHVDQNDPAVMNLALNNATNVIEYDVDIVTYGPGLHMLRADTSPVQDRVKQLKAMAFPSKVQFSACGNTKENMEKKEERQISVLPDATIVPSGVVRLMEKQEEGWSYVRP
jgi:uncharacterized protein